MQVLVVESPEDALPSGTASLLSDIGWHVTTASDYRSAADQTKKGGVDAVIFAEPHVPSPDPRRTDFQEFLDLVGTRRIAAVMLTDHAVANAEAGSLIDVVDRRIPLAELRGRLAMVERYHGLLKRMENELQTMERLSKRLGHHFQEVEQEMQLAARLQRDFLPKLSGPFGKLHFAAVYRPASWVSGDMYNVFRIDEEHTGMYIVDAVGHGMAAGLLTMFIKRAIIPTDSAVVRPPSRVIAALNDALAEQSLPHCQFVTACYATFHHPTATLSYARGGHPYPFLLSTGGTMRELRASGGLLGISKGEEFADLQTVLSTGEKVLFYSDGVELAFHGRGNDSLDTGAFRRVFEEYGRLPIEGMLERIRSRLDGDFGAADPQDDVTLLGFEVRA